MKTIKDQMWVTKHPGLSAIVSKLMSVYLSDLYSGTGLGVYR